jgi:hypothetical protein
VATVFADCCQPEHPDFQRFGERFALLAHWIHGEAQFGAASLGTVLAEISDKNPPIRDIVIQFLMRVAVNEADRFDADVCRAAVDILQSINIGTIVLVSPESKFSGASGGVGLYTTDIADTLSELGFHVVLVTPLYESNREYIHTHFAPQFDGYQFTVRFPDFDDHNQCCREPRSMSSTSCGATWSAAIRKRAHRYSTLKTPNTRLALPAVPHR